MAKQKVSISLPPENLKRIETFQKAHCISYLSKTVEVLVELGLDQGKLQAMMEESRLLQTEIARRSLSILSAISLNSEIPEQTKTTAKANAEKLVQKAVEAAKPLWQEGDE